jgi:CBS domain-containing protein
MTRRDEHFDAMLRQLGAAYYHTIHGDGAAAGVARALESAEAADQHPGEPGRFRTRHHSGRWLVSDVMTTDVVTVTKDTSYKQVAQVMTERKVNALPVLSRDGHVLGVVSEADVAGRRDGHGQGRGRHPGRHHRQRRADRSCPAAGLGGGRCGRGDQPAHRAG